jgi:hypothetical protein
LWSNTHAKNPSKRLGVPGCNVDRRVFVRLYSLAPKVLHALKILQREIVRLALVSNRIGLEIGAAMSEFGYPRST